MGRPADPTPHADAATHLQIRPTDTPLTAATVEQGFQRLHGLATSASWWDRLRGSDPQPTIEWRLHTPAGTDSDVALYVGVTTDATETLREALRTALPNNYELTPATPSALPAGESSADATTDDQVAAVEWVARPTGAMTGRHDSRR